MSPRPQEIATVLCGAPSGPNNRVAEFATVTVVIPCYNAGHYVEDAIRSVLAQDYSVLEIVIVDDGSTDDTAERVAQFGSRVKYVRQSNSGGYPGMPRNVGMQEGRGNFICFLDADDIMLQGRVSRQLAFLSRHPEVGLVYSDYRNFSESTQFVATHFQTCSGLMSLLGGQSEYLLASGDATALLLRENIGLPSSVMIRRGVLQRVPGFSVDMRTSEDFHFFYRIAREYAVGVVNHVGALRRLHDANITGDSVKTLHNYILSRTDLLRTEANADNKRKLEESVALREVDLARAYANSRQWKNSLRHNLRGLSKFAGNSGAGMLLGLRTLGRTAAIALGLKPGA